MLHRCSSAFGEKRREATVTKLVQSLAAKAARDGFLMDQADLDDLSRRINALYADAAVSSTSPLSSPVLGSSTFPRPSSAASSVNGRLTGVTQQQVDNAFRNFLADKRKVCAAEILPKHVVVSKPPLRPAALSKEALSHNEAVLQMPPALQAMLEANTPPFAASPSPSLMQCSRSYSEMKHSADVIESEIGQAPSPTSLRLRKIIRDADAYHQALEKAEEERRDKAAKKHLAAEKRRRLREDLDTQCAQRKEVRIAQSQEAVRNRLEVEQAVRDFACDQRKEEQQKRASLEFQKELNEKMRFEAQQLERQRRQEEIETSAQELLDIEEAARQARHLAVERKQCQAQLLHAQMQALVEKKKDEVVHRVQELKQANYYQKKMSELLDEQEQKRAQAKQAVLSKVHASERRAQRQYERVEGGMSDEQRREMWLANKLQRDTAELEQAAQRRKEREMEFRSNSQAILRKRLKEQMSEREARAQQEKARSQEWAMAVEAGLSSQAIRDDFKKQIAKEEQREWVHLLNAQAKYKHYIEAQDIPTSIVRSKTASPARAQSVELGEYRLHYTPQLC